MTTEHDDRDTLTAAREALELAAWGNHNKACELGLADGPFEGCQDPTCVKAREALKRLSRYVLVIIP